MLVDLILSRDGWARTAGRYRNNAEPASAAGLGGGRDLALTMRRGNRRTTVLCQSYQKHFGTIGQSHGNGVFLTIGGRHRCATVTSFGTIKCGPNYRVSQRKIDGVKEGHGSGLETRVDVGRRCHGSRMACNEVSHKFRRVITFCALHTTVNSNVRLATRCMLSAT